MWEVKGQFSSIWEGPRGSVVYSTTATIFHELAFTMIACNAASPSVSAAGPGCRINGDLISCSAPRFGHAAAPYSARSLFSIET
jgi:hypothetical protein